LIIIQSENGNALICSSYIVAAEVRTFALRSVTKSLMSCGDLMNLHFDEGIIILVNKILLHSNVTALLYRHANSTCSKQIAD